MKQGLLYGLMILMSSLVYSQVQGPPPVGYLAYHICDENGDGHEEFDLATHFLFPFSIPGEDASNYNPLVFYLSEDDRNNEVNPIVNTSNYINISNPQRIYYRTYAINPGVYDFLDGDELIHVEPIPTPNLQNALLLCDTNNNGQNIFDLTQAIEEILEGMDSPMYNLGFYETLTDAQNEINKVTNVYSYSNISNPQNLYVRVNHRYAQTCNSIVELNLTVDDCSDIGLLKLDAFYDANSNAIYDLDEIDFINGSFIYEINNDGIQHYLKSSSGSSYIMNVDESNTYDVSFGLYDKFQGCYDVTIPLYENVSVADGETNDYYFPITKESSCEDVGVYLVPEFSPRPGFNYVNKLVIINHGIEAVASGSVEFTFSPWLTINSISDLDSDNTITYTETGFILNFTNLQPYETEIVRINMKIPFYASLRAILTNTAMYSTNDLSLDNNYSELSQVIVGSFDPNDILESHGPEILHSTFDSNDYLYYTIRFQNVGTADAINVKIDNTLDARLDKSTIQMLNSSHSNVFTRVDDQLNWKFDNIHLPSEDMDEPASHGFVYYKIKPMAGYSVGDIIPNTAEIYFDFNEPVITNTFETEFITTLSNPKFKATEFSIFPNPASHLVALKFNKNINNTIKIAVYDIQGKQIINDAKTVDATTVNLDVSQLVKGMYFLKVNDGNSEITKKLIVK